MSAPLVSCIVPVFNGERYLKQALDSIAAQTHGPLQIIVADDGSTDGTRDLVRACGLELSCLSQANQGPASARNLGLQAARGDFVTFLDADDLWHPEKVARQLRRFHLRPELGVSVAHVRTFLEDSEAGDSGAVNCGAAVPGYITSTMMVRRSVFDRIGGFDRSLVHADDTDWFIRAGVRGVVIELLDDVLLFRRLHGQNMSRQRRSESVDEYCRLLKATLDERRRISPVAAPERLPRPPGDASSETSGET